MREIALGEGRQHAQLILSEEKAKDKIARLINGRSHEP
jgi:hypothetical protein